MLSKNAVPARVAIEGPLTVRTCHNYTCDLVSRIGAAKAFVLDISGCSEVDVAGVQLVESARRFAERSGVRLELAAGAEGRWVEVLERGGFVTAARPLDRAFWLHERGEP